MKNNPCIVDTSGEERKVTELYDKDGVVYPIEQMAGNAYSAVAIAHLSHSIPIPIWEEAQEWVKDTLTCVTRLIIDNPCINTEQFHAYWYYVMISAGWKYGEVPDLIKKEHPDIALYHKLSPSAKEFHAVFLESVKKSIVCIDPKQYTGMAADGVVYDEADKLDMDKVRAGVKGPHSVFLEVPEEQLHEDEAERDIPMEESMKDLTPQGFIDKFLGTEEEDKITLDDYKEHMEHYILTLSKDSFVFHRHAPREQIGNITNIIGELGHLLELVRGLK